MNLILWLLTGGLVGGTVAWAFSSALRFTIVDILAGIIGAVVFGLIASEYIPNTPILDLDQQSFSPGALLVSFLGSITLLIVSNLII